jgi:cell division protease FtsH
MGKENKSIVMDDDEKKIVAYHETGHGLLAALLENCDRPDKVSIIPRDMALGITSLTPGKDRYNVSKDFIKDQIVMLLGGRAAEKIACGTETAGAKDDIERATSLATAMVCEYGMSDGLGPIAINPRGHGADSMLQQLAQAEIMKLIKDSYERAQSMLDKNIELLHTISRLLIEKETISGDDIMNLVNKKP